MTVLICSFLGTLLAMLMPLAMVSVWAAPASMAIPHRATATSRPDIFLAPAANIDAIGSKGGPTVDKSGAGAREMASLRTRTTKTLISRAGFQLLTYPGSINYLDPSGTWQPIDDTLISTKVAGYSYRNKANSYTVYFPTDLSQSPVKFTLGKAFVTFSLVGSKGPAEVAGNTADFANSLGTVSIGYTALNDQLKETLSLSDPQTNSFSYVLHLSAGLTAKPAGLGVVDFVDRSGRTLFGFAPPSMVDGAGARSSAIQVQLTGTGSSLILTLTADSGWLHDKTRVFPVLIDPTVTISYSGSSIVKTYTGANQDCYLVSSSPTTSFCGGRSIYVGYSGSAIDRSLLQFNVSIPQDANILEADLAMKLSAGQSSTATSVFGTSAMERTLGRRPAETTVPLPPGPTVLWGRPPAGTTGTCRRQCRDG